MMSEILDQVEEYGVEVSYEGDTLIITGTIKQVHDADWVMGKAIPTIYGRKLYFVNYELDRSMRTYRRNI